MSEATDAKVPYKCNSLSCVTNAMLISSGMYLLL